MALTPGTNCGFVTARPTVNPSGTNTSMQGYSIAFKHTSPATAVKVVEIGFWIENSDGGGGMEVGIYTHNVTDDEPEALVGKDTWTHDNSTGWYYRTVDIAISPSTIYWIAVQCDDPSKNTNWEGTDIRNAVLTAGGGTATLIDPWGTSDVLRNRTYGFYAVWQKEAGLTDFTLDSATDGILGTSVLGGTRPSPSIIIGGLAPLHDFKRFPELTDTQMQTLQFDSPHEQILENFLCKVVKVIDGDTIRVSVDFRDFDFPVRVLEINAPELNEPKGEEVKKWLKDRIEGEEIEIRINPKNRVDKWGRLLGKIFHRGMDAGEEMLYLGMVTSFEARKEGKIPDINRELGLEWIN